MSNVINSTNMMLPVPIVGVEYGPQYALDINSCMAIIDQHDHSAGLGVRITPAGLSINSDLTIQNHNLTSLRSVRFQDQGSPIAAATDLGCVFVSGADLYYRSGGGLTVQITVGGSIAGSTGSISGLVAPASASYVSGSQTFFWKSAATTSANMDFASAILRNQTASSQGLTLAPPTAMGSSYTIVLPPDPSAAGGTKIMRLDISGNMTAALDVDNSTLQISANVLSVKSSGITATQLASNAVTTAKILDGNVTAAKLAAPFGSTQTFNSSGTYTVPANANLVQVYISGGGGGGGGSSSTYGGGGGGGSGPCVAAILVTPGAAIAVTVGAGGAGGATGSQGGTGFSGGSSSFGSLITVLGGQGGYGADGIPVNIFSIIMPGAGGRGSAGGGQGGGVVNNSIGNEYAGSPGLGAGGSGTTSSTGGGGGGGYGAGGNANTAAAANTGGGGGGGAAGVSGKAGGSGIVTVTVIG